MNTRAKKSAKKKQPVRPTGRARPGLGRGLGALIGAQEVRPDAPPAPTTPVPRASEPAVGPASGAGTIKVSVTDIHRSPWQPRRVFDANALVELTESIKAHGVIQPLICRRRPDRKGYELIAGERRLRAAADAGFKEVPVLIIEAADRDAAEMAIIENIQREDLNVIEEAEGYRSLCDGFGLTQQEVSERVGKARASVANAMRLLELPDEVKQLLSSAMLSTGHAKVLLSLSDEKEQIMLARRCVTEGQTVRALERAIQRRQTEREREDTRKPDVPEDHLRYLLDRLHARFGTQVRLQPSVTHANGKRTKGSLEIDFYDNDDLTRLLGMLGIEVE